MRDNQGASAKADRAGGPTDLSRCASQPKAPIPCAAGTLAQIVAVKSVLRRIEKREHGGLDTEIHKLLGREGEPPPYSTDLLAALDAIPAGWWWHLNHMECVITPNAPDPLIPVSNAADYKRDGRPIGYTAGWYGHRTELPLLVIQARLLALMALLRKKRAVECGNYQHVDTGKGPLVATPEGRLAEIGLNQFLSADNKLRRRRKYDRGAIDPVFVYGAPACDSDTRAEPGDKGTLGSTRE